MPSIQWYPGHIAKAERKLQEQTSLVDIIIEVIDARIPLSSLYEGIEKLTGNKPRLLIINKSDLADNNLNLKWVEYFEKKTKMPVILMNSSSAKDVSSVIKVAVELGRPQIEKLIAKGRLPRPIRAMVIGMPNVGKSSIINKLIKTFKARTGSKAGVTRATQWIRVNPKLELMDTPGIIPVKLDDQNKAVKLAIVNSISENAYNNVEIAQELLNILCEKYIDLLKSQYNLANVDECPALSYIACARNWLLPGGIPDINRCASVILADFRHGRIGNITLDDLPKNKNCGIS